MERVIEGRQGNLAMARGVKAEARTRIKYWSGVSGIILQRATIFGCILLLHTKAHSAIIKRPRYLCPKLDVNDMGH